jgi:hypothetical protein
MQKTVALLFAMSLLILLAMPAALAAEPSVEEIAGANGLVIGPETGLETLPVTPGRTHNVVLIAEYAGMKDGTSGGWYVAGDTSSRHQLFSGPDSPVINATFMVPEGVTEIGFYIQPEWYPGTYWYSETDYNTDGVDHIKIYYEESTKGYLIGFEDLCGGGDWDYNDHVILFGPAAPEFMFVSIPLGIVGLVLLLSYNSAKRKSA